MQKQAIEAPPSYQVSGQTPAYPKLYPSVGWPSEGGADGAYAPSAPPAGQAQMVHISPEQAAVLMNCLNQQMASAQLGNGTPTQPVSTTPAAPPAVASTPAAPPAAAKAESKEEKRERLKREQEERKAKEKVDKQQAKEQLKQEKKEQQMQEKERRKTEEQERKKQEREAKQEEKRLAKEGRSKSTSGAATSSAAAEPTVLHLTVQVQPGALNSLNQNTAGAGLQPQFITLPVQLLQAVTASPPHEPAAANTKPKKK